MIGTLRKIRLVLSIFGSHWTDPRSIGAAKIEPGGVELLRSPANSRVFIQSK